MKPIDSWYLKAILSFVLSIGALIASIFTPIFMEGTTKERLIAFGICIGFSILGAIIGFIMKALIKGAKEDEQRELDIAAGKIQREMTNDEYIAMLQEAESESKEGEIYEKKE